MTRHLIAGRPAGDQTARLAAQVFGNEQKLLGLTYMAGGLLFGTALIRANVLARWAAAVLAAGTLSSMAILFSPRSTNGCSPCPRVSP